MTTHRVWKAMILLLLALLSVTACRREEPTPTVAPIDETPTAEPADTPDETGGETGEPAEPISYDWPPQVVYASPQPGEEALLDGAVTIRFDQPMDQASVEAAFSIAAVDDPAAEPAGSFSWPEPAILVYTPGSTLDRATRYRVNIDPSASGANGLPLQEPVNLELETVGFIAVAQTLPEDGTRGVQTDAAITVFFNRPVVPLVATAQQADLPQPLSFDPPVSGEGTWIATSIYRFAPDQPLDGATSYQVTVDAGLTDVVGSVLEEAFDFSFTTVDPSVVSTVPEDFSDQVDPLRPITVTFNMPMDPAATDAALSLSGGSVPALETSWSADGRTVTLTPAAMLDLETDYQLTVDTGARSANGAAGLDKRTVIDFTTVPFPRIRSTNPERNEVVPVYVGGANVVFASTMDPETLEGQIRISPEPEDVETFLNTWDSRSNLWIQFDPLPETTYTVTIPGSAADIYGNLLGEDYTWSFTTDPLPALVSLNLPDGRMAQLTTNQPSSVDVVARRVSGVDLRLYDLGLPVTLMAEPGRVQYDYVPNGLVREWRVETALQDQAQAFGVDLEPGGGVLPTGVYYLTASAPEVDRDTSWWQIQGSLLLVADRNVVIKEMVDGVYAWVTDLATGEPVAGAPVVFYNAQSGVELGRATTDGSGLAAASYDDVAYLEGALAVVGTPGAPGFGAAGSVWSPNVNPWDFGLRGDYSAEPSHFGYVITDRPIYRPGDTIQFRGIVRETSYGRYLQPALEEVTLRVEPGFYSPEIGEPVELVLPLDDAGGFSGEYAIPEESPTGLFFLRPDLGGFEGTRVTVAEYRAPEFLVSVTPDETDLLRGEAVDVVVDAGYFFGGPAADLTLQWSVTASTYVFPWEGPFYSFSDEDTFFYDPFAGFMGGQQVLLSGEGRTDAAGQFTISVPANLLDDQPDGSRTVTVEATIFDISSTPLSGRAEVTFHAAQQYVGIVPTEYFGAAGLESSVDLLTTDWDANPAPGIDVEVVFYQREWEPQRVSRFGQNMVDWVPVDTEVARGSATTDDQGEAQLSFVPPEGGTYYVTAELTDATGRSARASTYLWVQDSVFVAWRTIPNQKRMDLVADQQSYQVGDTARILVQSPFTTPVDAWLTIERGSLIEQRVITLDGSTTTLELPVEGIYAPNVYVSVAAVAGADDGDYADIRLGQIELPVAPDLLALDVSVTPRADRLQPRETAVYDIRVTDALGRPVSADVTLALVDLAVLSLKPDAAEPILQAFYEPQALRSRTGSGLFVSGEGLEVIIPEQIFGMGGGGGGDEGAAEAFAIADEERAGEEGDTTVRRDFRDTAYWEGRVTTAADGTATVEVPLPDNLTTWRMTAHAVTADTLVGETTSDLIATLPLLLRPVTPRFFTVGDVVELGTVVNNNSGGAVEAEVSLQADGVLVDGDATQTVSLPAGGQALVRWTVTVEDVAFVDLTFRVAGGGFSDATKPTFGEGPDQLIPVFRYDAEDVVGTAGVLDEAGRRVEALLLPPNVDTRRGSVITTLTPSLGGALLEALTFTEDYDYEPACAGGYADRLLGDVAVDRALKQLGVDRPETAAALAARIPGDIERLAGLQRAGGGWTWCYGEQVDPYLTAYVLLGLAKAEEAGYEVDNGLIERALNVIEREMDPAARLTNAFQVNRQAFYLYVMAQNGASVTVEADELVEEHRDLLNPYARALLLLAYATDGVDSNSIDQLLSDLGSAAIVSGTGTHWEDAERDFRNLGSDIRGTAMVIGALAAVDADSPLGPPAVRWLMRARTAGHWPTTHETAWTIFMLSDWLAQTGEFDSFYGYDLSINGVGSVAGMMTEDNLLETVVVETPVDELSAADVNYFSFQMVEGDGRLYYTIHLDSYVAAESVAAVSRGISVQRAYYDAGCDPAQQTCVPLTSVALGQEVRVELTVVAENDLVYAMIEDPLPAGGEAQDPLLATTSIGAETGFAPQEQYRRGYWGWWYFNRIDFRDEKVVFFSEFLPAGTYQYSYTWQPTIPGEYQVMPPTAREFYFPEVFGRGDGMLLTVTE